MKNISLVFTFTFWLLSLITTAQKTSTQVADTARTAPVTTEDSLNRGLYKNNETTIGGYGEAKVQYDLKLKTGNANITRTVLFVGHKFSKKISFFSELELENAHLEGGQLGGEFSVEQLYLKFTISKDVYLTGGLIIPRIGIINENHLPTTFNGNDRPFVEQLVIPSTWREIGVGLYGQVPRARGFTYCVLLMNGLNAAGFQNGSGIAEGLFLGKNATASNLAINAAVTYNIADIKIQASGYFGGSVGLANKQADSLELNSGLFGTPVGMGELDAQYNGKHFSVRALGTFANIPGAFSINRAYANNTPQTMLGAYAEIGCNLLSFLKKETSHKLIVFARYEYLNLNDMIPGNGIYNGINKQQYIVTGLTYLPLRGIAIKLDYVFRNTGLPNPALSVNPFPSQQPYYTKDGFINFGIGYSF